MRVLHLARREWLEQRRQPAMLAVIATLYALVAGVVLAAVALLDFLRASGQVEGLGGLLGPEVGGEAALVTMSGVVVTGFSFLVFSQFLGIAGVLAGHAVLHDRQSGTLTFLLLAPIGRVELITGKVLGAIGPAWLLYLLIFGSAAVAVARFPVTAPHADLLPTRPAFWVAFLASGPSLAVFVSTVCTIVSALAHDVRTAQQGVWFVLFFATLAGGFLLTNALPAGPGVQVAVALGGAVATAVALQVGASVITRDLGR